MMSKIPVSALVSAFQLMEAEHWSYKMGSAKRGEADCSGAYVWAYNQYGHSIYHGSNRMARVEVDALIPINVANIVHGMAAFKHHKPGEAGYALPSGYKPGGSHYNGDLNDYYHVGLVDEDTTRVLNAQSAATGFVASPISKGGWSHVAYLKQVDYGAKAEQPTVDEPKQKEVDTMASAEIYAANGKAVNLRKGPSTATASLKQLPVGTKVDVISETDSWVQVTAGGLTGWVMREFVRGWTGIGTEGGMPSDIEERLARLEERVTALEGGHG